MTVTILILWFLIFIIFLIIHLQQNSADWGIITSFWLLLIGLAVLVTGLEIESGMTIETSGSTQTLVYQYADVAAPFSTYSYMWGVFFIALFIYMLYVNAEKKWG